MCTRARGGGILTSLFFVPPALCVTRYGALPLVANLLGVFRLLNPGPDVVDYPEITFINSNALIAKGTAAMLGGPSLWGTVIKIKSRVLPLIYGPRRILSGECPFRRLYMYQ